MSFISNDCKIVRNSCQLNDQNSFTKENKNMVCGLINIINKIGTDDVSEGFSIDSRS